MFEYAATALHVVDGDTLDVLITLRDETVDLGFRIMVHDHDTFEQRIRLYGINTPERGQPGYDEATAMLTALVVGAPGLYATTVKPHDKYGRWLASLRTTACPDVAQALIDAGLGVAYFGGAR